MQHSQALRQARSSRSSRLARQPINCLNNQGKALKCCNGGTALNATRQP